LSRVDSSGYFNGKSRSLKNESGRTSGTSSGVGTPAVVEEVSSYSSFEVRTALRKDGTDVTLGNSKMKI
jgi:hypothetical protein